MKKVYIQNGDGVDEITLGTELCFVWRIVLFKVRHPRILGCLYILGTLRSTTATFFETKELFMQNKENE